MEDKEKQRREVIVLRYEKHKKKVKDWENAVYRTEGRKPQSSDMKQAPKDVQDSYREYIKIRKYLENAKDIPSAVKEAKALTPGKIFLGSKRSELQRGSKTSFLVQTPDKMFRRSTESRHKPALFAAAAASSRTNSFGLGLRSKRHSDEFSDRGSADASPLNLPFKKLFTLAGKTEKQKAATATSSNEKPKDLSLSPHKEENDKPFTSAGTSFKFSLFNKMNVSKPADVNSSNADESGNVDDADENMEVAETDIPRALKSPRTKTKQNVRSAGLVDTGWLARLNSSNELNETEQSEPNKSINEAKSSSANTSGSDFGLPKSPDNKLNDSNNSNESVPLNDSSTAMEVDGDEGFQRTRMDSSAAAVATKITSENTDSGICVSSSSLFNASEVHQAIQEVLDESNKSGNGTTSNVSFSDADASLLYSFTEDACLPSDLENDELTLDSKTMSKIMQALSENIEETNLDGPNSTNVSHHKEDNDFVQNRKRPARFAFSPSPKKPVKPRKFFKSGRGDRVKPTYVKAPSFGPLTPIKESQSKKSIPKNASNILNSAASKLVSKSKKLINANVEEEPKASTSSSKPDVEASNQKTSRKSDASKTGKGRSKKKIIVKYMESDSDDEQPKPTRRKNAVIDVFDDAPIAQPGPGATRRKGGRVAGRKFPKNDTLERKMENGKLDENFVRIDTKRKVFVRGHRKISVTKLKRLDWKNRKANQGKDAKSATSSFTCHKCGEKGHFAKFCMKDFNAGNNVGDEIPEDQQDDSPFPTLEEAAMMVYKGAASNRVNIYTTNAGQLDETQTGENQSSEMSAPEHEPTPILATPTLVEPVDPVFNDEFSDADLEEETMMEGLQAFGYDSFRSGQKEAVRRILKGLSTLLILSTGSGKSLCYQLPAYLYAQKHPGALTLCISPLVSLMEDQVQGLPSVLNAACLHSNMTTKQKTTVLDQIKSRKLHVLLVSPEAVCGGLFGLLRGNSDSLPKISFACIDEVHCVSQWSHNFRPSYLQLCKMLREKLHVQTILGLTATATKTTVDSICEHLNIDPSSTIRGELIPRNLKLSVSRDLYKEEALITLLQGERFCNCDSIIIYCTRREECEKIATFVRTKLQEITTTKFIKTKTGARLSGSCEAYHAGMTPRRRKNVQEGFMSGSIRIVVATVAFGMGIDKSDIRAIIHYNMPSAFESYVQEIGRAGRDGLPAHCHLFLDNTRRNDLCELKRHVFANSVDRPTVRRLLRKAFQSCKCKRIQELKGNTSDDKKIPCEGHEVSFSIEGTVTDLDLPKENITTLLCYLELGPKKWIEMLPLTYETCKIQSYGGSKVLKYAAARCPPLAVAIALQKEKNQFFDTDTFIEFNVIEAAATVGWNSAVVKKELKNLEWIGSQYDAQGNATRFRKSGLMVEFSNLAYRLRSQGSLSDKDADEVLNYLHSRNVHQEQTQLHQLNRVYHALLSVSFPNINNLCETFDEEKSEQLKCFIHEYFSEDASSATDASNDINEDADKVEELRRSIRRLIDSNKDVNFTTRSIARIFQGISSPCFPAEYWYKSRDFWRRYLDVDFHFICRIASEEL